MEKQRVELQRAWIIQMVYIAMIIGLIVLFFKYVMPIILPFVIAFAIAAACMPIVRKLSTSTRLKNNKVWGLVIIMTLYVSVGTLIGFLIVKAVNALVSLTAKLPDLYYGSILPAINQLKAFVIDLLERISPARLDELHDIINDSVSYITSKMLEWSGSLASVLTSLSLSLPSFFLIVFFAVMASIFIIMDYDGLVDFMKKQLSEKTVSRIQAVIKTFIHSLKDYLRAYALISLITFIELAIGFFIIGLPNALLVAFGIALFDFIPIFGTGGIMIPWIIIAFLNGNVTLGIQLLVIYGIVSIVRQVVEPKMVGKQLGLNTVVALIVMYVGLQVFGVIGMIFAPIITVMVINFKEREQMNWWK